MAKASVTGAPILAANAEYMAANKDLSVLLGNGENGDNLYKEYLKLEKECENLSVEEIVVKAYPFFIKQENMEKGAIFHCIAISRYDDRMPDKDKVFCINAYTNLGYYLLFERNNPVVAYPFFIRGLEIAEIIESKEILQSLSLINSIVAIHTNIAKIFAIYNDYPKAMYYYRKAYEIAKKYNNSIAVPMSFTDLLHFAWTSDSLYPLYNDIKEFIDLKIPNSAYQTMHDYAKLMAAAGENYLQKDYSGALNLVDSALNKYDNAVDDRRCLAFNRIIAGKSAFANKDYDKALEYFSQGEDMIKDGKLEDMYDLLYQLHTDFHIATGNPMLAEQTRNEALRVKDSLHNLQSYSVIRDMELSLQAHDYNDQLSTSRSETRMWLYIAVAAVIVIFVICGLVIYIIIKNRKLKEHSENLFRKNIELIEAQKRYEMATGTKSAKMIDNPVVVEENQNLEESPKQSVQTFTGIDETSPEKDIVDENIDKEDLNKLYEDIIAYLANNPFIFRSTFNIETLASGLGLKWKQVSQIINTVGGKNFNTLLGEFRVKKACEKMMENYDDPLQRPTIEALAYEVGYSRTHFMRVFKSVTGLTTSEFLKQIKNKTYYQE